MDIIAQIIIAIFFLLLMIVFLILFIALYQKRQRRHRQEKQLLQTQYEQEILKTRLEIQEHTFTTISQEIHDNIGQVLSLTKLNINTMDVAKPVELQRKITDSRSLLTKAIADLRQLTQGLHGDKVADIGLVAAIENEVVMLNNIGQFVCTLQVTGDAAYLGSQKEILLFRIVQEALHNIIKHAKATRVVVALQYAPEQLGLRITDDGQGFDPGVLLAAQTGIGLKTMQSRAALMGGTLKVDTAPGRGCTMLLALPVAVGENTVTTI